MELLMLLGLPLLGSLLLAVIGRREWAPEANVLMSAGTFAAGVWLTAHVIAHGPMLVWHEQFFIDPFNVFLVILTSFIGLTTSLFSRPYLRTEEQHGRLNRGQLRLYHSMFQLFIFTMLLALTTNNMGIQIGRAHV